MPKNKNRTYQANVSYFRSESQRKRTSRLSFLYGSKQLIAVFAVLACLSLLTGLLIVQESRNSKAAIDSPLAVSCTKTINSGSISSSVNALSSGQTLCLDGTFNQNVSITKAGVTLASIPGKMSRINGQLKINQGANNVRVVNLYLNGNGVIVSPHVLADNAYFYGNQVTNQGSTRGICFAIGETTIGKEVQGITIDSNRIFKCGTVYHDQGIYAEYVRNAIIRNNYIYDNPDFGIQFYPSAQNSIFEYNVVDGNKRGITFSSEGGSINKTSSGNVVRYNIITNSPDAYNLNYWWGGPVGQNNRAENNCVFGGGKGNLQPGLTNYVTVSGTVTADPMFVNRAAKDFRLKAGSPCAKMGPQTAASTNPAPSPSPAPSPQPAPVPSPVPSPSSPTPAPVSNGSPVVNIPGSSSTQPVPIPNTIKPDSEGNLTGDFDGDGQNEVVKDTNNDGRIDTNTETITASGSATRENNAATSNLDASTNDFFASQKEPESSTNKPMVYTLIAGGGITLVGIGFYLLFTKLALFTSFRGKI